MEGSAVLVKNSTTDAKVTLYIYSAKDLVCWVSYKSKIIPPGDKYLYREIDSTFKFNLKAVDSNGKKHEILPVRKCEVNKLFDVQDSLKVRESDLSNHPCESKICLRRNNMEKELASEGGRNLYELLKLDMTEVRKESIDKQNDMIKKAFHREIRRWHTDHNRETGDDHIASEVYEAYKVLRDPEKRCDYNNMVDYDKGWLSKSRWHAIFNPECYTEEQKKAKRRRWGQIALSVFFGVGGVALSACTAGLASPVLVVLGAIIGGGLTGSGIQTFLRIIKRKSIEDGSDWKSYLKCLALGFVTGAMAGGAAAGITAGIAGIGHAASEAAKVTVGQFMAIGGSSGAIGGAIASLSVDAERRFIDKERVTLKQLIFHVLCGASVGGTAGILGGLVTKALAGATTQASATSLEQEAVEQVIIRAWGKRLGILVAQKLSRALAEVGSESIGNLTARFLEERSDDSVENRPPTEHLTDAAKSLGIKAFIHGGMATASAIAVHAKTEIEAEIRVSKALKQSSKTYRDLSNAEKRVQKQNALRNIHEESGKFLKWQDSNGSKTYSADSESKIINPTSKTEIQEEMHEVHPLDPDYEDPQHNGRLRYVSEGLWKSRMIVQYELDAELITKEAAGSGESIAIPAAARDIRVRFQVLRSIGIWCDIKKYDRFHKRWCQPTEAHIFSYETPPIRTFTISGSLYYEAVMNVTDELFDELKEL